MRNFKQVLVLGALIGSFLPTEVAAQDAGLRYAQAGALLAYGEAELKLLYSCLTAKEFDPALTKSVSQELERALNEAKKTVDRAVALLAEDQAKLEPELVKLRELIKATEDQHRSLATDIEEQTNPKGPAEDAPVDELDEEEPKKIDWELLKTGAGWLGVDLKAARAKHRSLATKMRLRSMRFPPKPRGQRK